MSPAHLIGKPRRLPNRRRPLDEAELHDLWAAVATTTRDPDLDLLLLRFHLETGARRIGAVRLRLQDVDPVRQTLWLREKFDAEREQPISRSLLDAVSSLATARGSTSPQDPAFQAAAHPGRRPTPLSDRTYDRIFSRAQPHIPWSARTPVTAHVLRYTAIAAVRRIAGYAVAQVFAGHQPTFVTATYTRPGIDEVAAVVAVLTGESHPLAGH
jgi:integrase